MPYADAIKLLKLRRLIESEKSLIGVRYTILYCQLGRMIPSEWPKRTQSDHVHGFHYHSFFLLIDRNIGNIRLVFR